MAKYDSYEEYVEAAKKYYEKRDGLKVNVDLMIMTKEVFDLFDGVVDFGPGSSDRVNREDGCRCKPTFEE